MRRESAPAVEAPARRSGRQCGYEHREALLAANRTLGKVLTALARDPDPEARRLGAELAADVTAYVAAAAAKADAGSSRSKRIAADLERRLPRIAEQLDRARTRLHPSVQKRQESVTTP